MRTSDFDPISIEIFNRQLKIAAIFIVVVFSILILRLWFMQIVNGAKYRTKSERNRFHLIDIPPFRGIILDRKGEMLVGNRPSYDLYVIPEEIQDREQLLTSLNQLASIDPEQAKQRLNEFSNTYPFKPVCLKKDISRVELAVIETNRFNLPGVMINVKPQRHYVCGNLASHLLGYLGEISDSQLKSGSFPYSKRGDLVGKSGVERKWQADLNGVRGGEQVEVDAAGRKIRVISRKPPISGASIHLTIDKDLQALAEKALNGKKGAIVAIDPQNGEILTLASSPSFNPNMFIGGIDKSTWGKIISSKDFPLQNRALSGQYPPGSLFKIIVALAGLEEGIIDPSEEVVCNGCYLLGDDRYNCWNRKGHGKVDLHRSLVESCDVYFYKLGKKLGIDKIAYYAMQFGLGKTTGFDIIQGEKGLVPTRDWKLKKVGEPWQTGETISFSIGQSYALATPIQMTNLISAVFNGGLLYKPQGIKIVEKAENDIIYKFSPKLTGKIAISQENQKIIKKALIDVVNNPRGTGTKAKSDHHLVAGKTGTAQVVSLDKEKEYDDKDKIPLKFRDHAWFVAIAPVELPKIALSIVIEHGGHGGSAAAPIAKDMIDAYLGTDQ